MAGYFGITGSICEWGDNLISLTAEILFLPKVMPMYFLLNTLGISDVISLCAERFETAGVCSQ